MEGPEEDMFPADSDATIEAAQRLLDVVITETGGHMKACPLLQSVLEMDVKEFEKIVDDEELLSRLQTELEEHFRRIARRTKLLKEFQMYMAKPWWDLDLDPKMVVGGCIVSGELYYGIKWKDDAKTTFIPARIVRIRWPEALISFYECRTNSAFFLEPDKDPFDRGLEPEEIIGLSRLGGKEYAVVKWKNSDDVTVVPTSLAKIGCPQLYLLYREKHVVLCKDGQKGEEYSKYQKHPTGDLY